jgi:hypothetical protein
MTPPNNVDVAKDLLALCKKYDISMGILVWVWLDPHTTDIAINHGLWAQKSDPLLKDWVQLAQETEDKVFDLISSYKG